MDKPPEKYAEKEEIKINKSKENNEEKKKDLGMNKMDPGSIIIGKDKLGNIIYKLGRFIVSSVISSEEEEFEI